MTMQTTTEVVIPEEELVDRLHRAMRHAGLNQLQIADELEFSRNTISHYLTGKLTPRRGTVIHWARVCGVDPDWLVFGSSGCLCGIADEGPCPVHDWDVRELDGFPVVGLPSWAGRLVVFDRRRS